MFVRGRRDSRAVEISAAEMSLDVLVELPGAAYRTVGTEISTETGASWFLSATMKAENKRTERGSEPDPNQSSTQLPLNPTTLSPD